MNRELESKRLYIFDMDGTIYLGGRVFDCAVRFIDSLRAAGHTNPGRKARKNQGVFQKSPKRISGMLGCISA